MRQRPDEDRLTPEEAERLKQLTWHDYLALVIATLSLILPYVVIALLAVWLVFKLFTLWV